MSGCETGGYPGADVELVPLVTPGTTLEVVQSTKQMCKLPLTQARQEGDRENEKILLKYYHSGPFKFHDEIKINWTILVSTLYIFLNKLLLPFLFSNVCTVLTFHQQIK